MTRIKRPAAFGAAALLALTLTACGGGGGADAPADASEEEFCDAFNAVFEPLGDGEEPTEEEFEEFQDRVAELGEVGTPEGISDEQREGFEVFIDAMADADYDEIKDLEDDAGFPGVSEEDNAKAEEFANYAFEKCFEVPEVPDLEETPTE